MQFGMIGLGRMGQLGATAAQGRPPVRGLRQVTQSVEELVKEQALIAAGQ
jgi:6-phosphogluconate dehydrogenase (decarboxylating)